MRNRTTISLWPVFTAAHWRLVDTLQIPCNRPRCGEARLSKSLPLDRILVAVADGEIVGNLGLHQQAHTRRAHVAGTWHGRARRLAWQRDVGKALLRSAIDLADNWLGLMRLELTVWCDNTMAQRLYAGAGLCRGGHPPCLRLAPRALHRCHCHGASAPSAAQHSQHLNRALFTSPKAAHGRPFSFASLEIALASLQETVQRRCLPTVGLCAVAPTTKGGPMDLADKFFQWPCIQSLQQPVR